MSACQVRWFVKSAFECFWYDAFCIQVFIRLACELGEMLEYGVWLVFVCVFCVLKQLFNAVYCE